ncbi:MAG: DEAD/DEAH box helicase, partial [Sphingopyxis sp.]
MRPTILNPLFTEITAQRGVGPQFVRLLERLGITRVKDALFHLPTGWLDRNRVTNVDDGVVGRGIIIPLTAQGYQAGRSPRAPFRVSAFDVAGNAVSIVYFGRAQGMARKAFELGEQRLVVGRLDQYGDMLQIVQPSHVLPMDRAGAVRERESVYRLTEGLPNSRIAQIIADAMDGAPALDEWIEPGWRAQNDWPDWKTALANAHADHMDKAARDRLAYDELFAGQLALLLVRESTRQRRGRAIVGDGRLRDKLALPFALTGAQRRTIAEIDGDMAQNAPMLRLLQGDVGSGKTMVALMALLATVEAGAQGALLAPTEILARQHYESLRRMLAGLPVSIAVLTGRDKGRAREATLMGLADGSINIIIGTHALFQDAVTYRDLGLIVVDEQHKFGVAQRVMLAAKGQVPP